MKVKCINDKWQAGAGCEWAPRPIFLQDYTVVETKVLEGTESHILAEMGDEYGYDTKFFATLPDTPAELIEETETELVTA